ncbi:MAG TPA: GDSL-type esterase/lipase family protein [Xanthobacteraceae bacterium]|nr:GDSL-type esterase/lipase family protein [Xanthobacteraceae bacterium]
MNRLARIFALAMALGAFVFAAPLQARPLNIVAIGASNTTGFGVGEQNAYPAVLQALLRKRGIQANVINAGVNGDVTAGMLRRIDSAVPKGTDIVILQPGGNDLRFFGTKAARSANIAAMAARMRARGIRVMIYDPDPVPADFYQWDHIHFNAAAHAKIAATLAAEIEASLKAKAVAQPAAAPPTAAPAKP